MNEEFNNEFENELDENAGSAFDGEYNSYDSGHLAPSYQPLRGSKKTAIAATSLTLAGLIGVGLATSAVVKRHKKPVIEPEPIVQETELVTEPEIDHGNLILWEDFDIDNADEVRKRAQAIYDISEKKYSVDEIVNMIYYFNEKHEKIVFKNGASKEEKFKYLQNLAIHLSSLLSNNLQDDLDRMYSLLDKENMEDDVLANEDSEIYAYMFMAGNKRLEAETMTGEKVDIDIDDKGAKGYAIALALEVEAQLDAIKNGNVEVFKNNAESFYKIVEEINNLKNTSDGYMVLMIDDYKAKYPLYGDSFTKEQKEVLMNTTQNNYLNSLGFEASKKTGASYDANKGNHAVTTPVTERAVVTDRVNANKRETTTRKFETPAVIDEGGKKVTTSRQVIVSPGTTKVETTTFIASTTKPITTETTIIEKGGEVVSESYVDQDAIDAERYATEPSTEIDEQNSTTKYVDADSTTFVIEEGGIRLS